MNRVVRRCQLGQTSATEIEHHSALSVILLLFLELSVKLVKIADHVITGLIDTCLCTLCYGCNNFVISTAGP